MPVVESQDGEVDSLPHSYALVQLQLHHFTSSKTSPLSSKVKEADGIGPSHHSSSELPQTAQAFSIRSSTSEASEKDRLGIWKLLADRVSCGSPDLCGRRLAGHIVPFRIRATRSSTADTDRVGT